MDQCIKNICLQAGFQLWLWKIWFCLSVFYGRPLYMRPVNHAVWWMSTIRDQSTLKWDTKKANWYKALYGACIVFLSCHSSATKWTLKTNIFKNAAHTCRVWWMWNHPQSFFSLSKPEHLWLLRSYHGGAIMSAINVTLHDVLLWKTTRSLQRFSHLIFL